jgi:SSS family solute:Na+ symporter/sodium/pantothenate symporter
MAALIVFIIASMWIGMLANRAMQSGTFMKGFFLGNRGLGAWALALTATVQSGGTFMGFPSLVYTHGWIVALWICGYMVVPITGFGVLGKRIAQLSRKTGALTVPDLFRARFNSPALGLTASLLIMFYMSFMMVAQFKAGATIMKEAWPRSKQGTMLLTEDAAAFQLTDDKIRGLGLPEAVAEKLMPLDGVGFDSGAQLKKRLGELLTQDEFALHQESIVKTAQLADMLFYIGLIVFTLTVVGYTLLGGFLAAVWTDLFQSVMMLVGVLVLLVLAVVAAGGMEHATAAAIERTGSSAIAFGPGFDPDHKGHEFLPLGLAFSFFWVWVYSGVGSPAGMVRVMAGKSTEVIRKSIFLLSGYNFLIYLPLVIICICGRALVDLPPGKTDAIVPRLALVTTENIPGGSLIAGLILAAPFGAVMATVSSYLVVIASGLVRDVYQRFINPQAGTHDLRRLSYLAMIAVGAVAVAANIKPVDYLQAIVVFSGTGAAATFCVPALMLAYWRRTTVAGMLASMLGGAGTMVLLYGLGFAGYGKDQHIGQVTRFRPYFLLDLDPLLWGLAASLVAGLVVSLCTAPPEDKLVSRLFDVEFKPGPEA